MENILRIQQLSKNFGSIHALQQVSFEVPEGSVMGILGPNGSGKTTLLSIILDVLKASSGSYEWLRLPSTNHHRTQIGTLLETPNFYHYLSAVDNLKITAAIKNCSTEDIEPALKLVGLWERKDSAFQTYSLGMKQRLAIANALLGKPKVLVLDEPTNGMDPMGISEIRALIKTLNQNGTTIIMASHLLDEVEKVCTHVAILKQGQLLIAGPVLEVLSQEDCIEVKAQNLEALLQLLLQYPASKNVRISNDTVMIYGNELDLAHINQYCMQQGTILTHLLQKRTSLEAKFIELTAVK